MERLDKLIASQGTHSRKEVKSLITKGRVLVNGNIEKSSDKKVNITDSIIIDGKELNFQKFIYLMLNKPQGYVTAVKDSKDKTVLDLVPLEYKRNNLFPVGRLDKDTTGLLIITDDGPLAHNLLSPKKHVPKTYLVTIDIPMTLSMKERFQSGIQLNDGLCKPAYLNILTEFTGEITIEEGKYHQIKRMFGCCGGKVVALQRISMGSLKLDETLLEGYCRPLTNQELTLLAFSSSVHHDALK